MEGRTARIDQTAGGRRIPRGRVPLRADRSDALSRKVELQLDGRQVERKGPSGSVSFCSPTGEVAGRWSGRPKAALPWYAGQIDTLVAGRRLRQANWVLEHETAPFAADPGALPEPAVIVPYFEWLEAEFRALLDAAP